MITSTLADVLHGSGTHWKSDDGAATLTYHEGGDYFSWKTPTGTGASDLHETAYAAVAEYVDVWDRVASQVRRKYALSDADLAVVQALNGWERQRLQRAADEFHRLIGIESGLVKENN